MFPFVLQFKEVSQANPTVVVPITTGGGQSSRFIESRFSDVRSTPTTFTYVAPASSGGHHSSSYRESHSSQAAAPQVITYPIGGGSSSQYQESSSSSTGNRGFTSPIITYPVTVPAGSSSHFSESSSSGNHGGYTAPIATFPVAGGASSSQFSETSSSTGGSHGGNVGFISSGYPIHSRFGSDFGSEFGSSSSSFGSGSSSNLVHYMTESERLARLQAQNIQGQHGYKGATTVDLGSANLVAQPTAGSRQKSWEKSSKWSSQTEVSSFDFSIDEIY